MGEPKDYTAYESEYRNRDAVKLDFQYQEERNHQQSGEMERRCQQYQHGESYELFISHIFIREQYNRCGNHSSHEVHRIEVEAQQIERQQPQRRIFAVFL